MRGDDGFEDREGHQAPFTLPEEQNVQRPTGREPKSSARSFELFDLGDEGVEVGPFAGTEFGVECFAIDADFEGAAAGWNQGERRNPIAKIENFSRQTDGFRRVVSNAAILDPDFGSHRSLLSFSEVSGKRIPVKAARRARDR